MKGSSVKRKNYPNRKKNHTMRRTKKTREGGGVLATLARMARFTKFTKRAKSAVEKETKHKSDSKGDSKEYKDTETWRTYEDCLGKTCASCKVKFTDKDVGPLDGLVYISSCNHYFHNRCMWFMCNVIERPKCPICEEGFKKNECKNVDMVEYGTLDEEYMKGHTPANVFEKYVKVYRRPGGKQSYNQFKRVLYPPDPNYPSHTK